MWQEKVTYREAHFVSIVSVKKEPALASLQSKYSPSTAATNAAPSFSPRTGHHLRGRISPFMHGSNSQVTCGDFCVVPEER